ncbi:hypothetical protein TNCV_4631871 [Trichonephila clavipes]|nr:hypothetical protein TNCV_4631871 [Trichonephila clavipes]
MGARLFRSQSRLTELSDLFGIEKSEKEHLLVTFLQIWCPFNLETKEQQRERNNEPVWVNGTKQKRTIKINRQVSLNDHYRSRLALQGRNTGVE